MTDGCLSDGRFLGCPLARRRFAWFALSCLTGRSAESVFYLLSGALFLQLRYETNDWDAWPECCAVINDLVEWSRPDLLCCYLQP